MSFSACPLAGLPVDGWLFSSAAAVEVGSGTSCPSSAAKGSPDARAVLASESCVLMVGRVVERKHKASRYMSEPLASSAMMPMRGTLLPTHGAQVATVVPDPAGPSHDSAVRSCTPAQDDLDLLVKQAVPYCYSESAISSGVFFAPAPPSGRLDRSRA
jgi:hypothetical protein